MLKAEDLKIGTIIQKHDCSSNIKILHISGVLYFLSAEDDYEVAGHFFTLSELNAHGFKLAEETQTSKLKVGQVWESSDGARALIFIIDVEKRIWVTFLNDDTTRCSLFKAGYSTYFPGEKFREDFGIFSTNQSREIILGDEA